MIRVLSVAVAFTALFEAASCQRTPEEPTPSPSRRVTPEEPRTILPGAGSAMGEAVGLPADARARCIRATPVAPPPSVDRGPDPRCPKDPEPNRKALPMVSLRFPDARFEVAAELAERPQDTERGLMYRRELGEGRGMLFKMAWQEHSFWMRNTCIPLDMLFVDDDGLIVGILENVPTMNDDIRTVGCPSRYVLELDAGSCRRHGIRAGQKMEIGGSSR
jgi:uncharacterized membrane protein (UPF0127 family)